MNLPGRQIVEPNLAGLAAAISLAPPGHALAREEYFPAVGRDRRLLGGGVEQQFLARTFGHVHAEQPLRIHEGMIALAPHQQRLAVGKPLLDRRALRMKRDLGRESARNVPTYTWRVPVRSLVNAMRLPSGEKWGCVSRPGCVFHGRATPPLEETSQMSPRQAKARVAPSGDKAGAVAKRMASPADKLGSISAMANHRHGVTNNSIRMTMLLTWG